MGREHGIEGTSGDAESGTEPTEAEEVGVAGRPGRQYVIVGVPGSGKSRLKDAVREILPDLRGKAQPWLYVAPTGLQADYRSELFIASSRACAIFGPTVHDYLHTTSLVDSLAYSITNARRLVVNKGVDDEMVDAWAWVSGCIMWMFRHSFRYDHVFLIEQDDLDDEMYDFQALLTQVLDDNSIPYTLLDGDSTQWPDQVVKVIEGYGSN